MQTAKSYQQIAALMLLCLPLLIGGCSSSQLRTEYIYVRVPDTLTQPTPIPAYTGETYGDLIDYVPQLVKAIRQSNADKSAINQLNKPGSPEFSSAEKSP